MQDSFFMENYRFPSPKKRSPVSVPVRGMADARIVKSKYPVIFMSDAISQKESWLGFRPREGNG